MFKKLLFLVLMLSASTTFAQGLTLTVNGSFRASITAQGIPGQPIVLVINFNQPGAIIDTVLTDSLGNFSRIYAIPPGWTSGIVLAQAVCGNSFAIDSSGWFPGSMTSTVNLFCTGSPTPPTPRFICGSISPLAAGDTAIIELFRMTGGAFLPDTTFRVTDSTGTGFAAYCVRVMNGTYRIRASLSPGSVNASTFLPTWFGNTTNVLSAQSIFVPTSGSIANIVLQSAVSSPVNRVFGTVSGFTSPAGSMLDTVRLILIEVQNGIWAPIDTLFVIDSAGVAYFNIPVNRIGQFSLLATLMSGNAANYVPTYLGNVTTWSQAQTFSLVNGSVSNAFITLAAAGGTGGGNGGVGGGVNQNGLPVTGSAGIPGVQVQLHSTGGQVLKATHSNTQGSYNFSQLPYGDYKLHVEMMGVAFTPYAFSITAANPNPQIHFSVSNQGIAASLLQETFILEGIYPNPVQGQAYIRLTGNEAGLVKTRLLDLQGRMVVQKQFELTEGNNEFAFDVNGVVPGMYFIEVESAGKRSTQRVVVQ
jgi:hypothetical protein